MPPDLTISTSGGGRFNANDSFSGALDAIEKGKKKEPNVDLKHVIFHTSSTVGYGKIGLISPVLHRYCTVVLALTPPFRLDSPPLSQAPKRRLSSLVGWRCGGQATCPQRRLNLVSTPGRQGGGLGLARWAGWAGSGERREELLPPTHPPIPKIVSRCKRHSA